MSLHDPPHAMAPGTEPEQSADWQLVSLIDPAGQGGDLAYTQGLSDLGQPELLLWARPTEGLDPGVDWLLTHRERSRLLNRWAAELLTGQLQPGQQREERFDGGHTVARFRFGRSMVASAAQFPYLVPGSRVICAVWSLLRRAPGRSPLPPGATVARRMQRWIAAAEAVTVGWQLRSGSPEPTDGAEAPVGAAGFGAPGGNRFGPMTRWVDARVAQVLAADPDVIAAFAGRLLLAEQARCEDCLLEDLTGWPLARTGTAPAGRPPGWPSTSA